MGPEGRWDAPSCASSSSGKTKVGIAAWPVLLAVGAAFGIGFGAALQQQAAHDVTGPGSDGLGFIAALLRRRSWLVGVAGMVAGFGLQAAALGLGRLAVVEPILAASLVVAIVVAAVRRRRRPRRADWFALLLATAGVAAFVIVADPTGGRPRAAAAAFAPLLIALGAIGAATLWRAPRWYPARAAMALGAIAGTALGCSDALVKTTVADASSQHLAVLATFSPYLLVIVGAAGFVLLQYAYRVGELKAALPAASVMEPVTGTVLGLTLFGERIAMGDFVSGLALAAAAATAIVGVWRLGGSPLLGKRAEAAGTTIGSDTS